MKELLHEIGINIGISVAGLFGSLLLIGKTATVNLRATFFSLISGVASANYITPIVLDITRVDVKYQMSVGFILGFLGLKGVEYITNKFIKKVDNGDANVN
jgi:hypothetical protein